MATAIKRISDGKIVIECSEEEFLTTYLGLKEACYVRQFDAFDQVTKIMALRKDLSPLYKQLKK